jgi:hypothetical protein
MKGFFRLWIVFAFAVVPGLAIWQFHRLDETWSRLDQMSIHICVSREGEPNFDVDQCIGPAKTVFQHENITPGAYWGQALGFSFAAYLVLTGIMIGVFYVFRWVIRGFASSRKSDL